MSMPLETRHIRWMQAVADFQMALSAVIFICELDERAPLTRIEKRRYRFYEDAAIMAYARPFLDRNDRPRINPQQLVARMTDDEMALHQRILDKRREIIAQSDLDHGRAMFMITRTRGGCASNIPDIYFDETLEFFEDRWKWMDWLRRLIVASSEILSDFIKRPGAAQFTAGRGEGASNNN